VPYDANLVLLELPDGSVLFNTPTILQYLAAGSQPSFDATAAAWAEWYRVNSKVPINVLLVSRSLSCRPAALMLRLSPRSSTVRRSSAEFVLFIADALL
jgi:hypothetical protein